MSAVVPFLILILGVAVVITLAVLSDRRTVRRLMPHLRLIDDEMFKDGRLPSRIEASQRPDGTSVLHLAGATSASLYWITRFAMKDDTAVYHVEIDTKSGPFIMVRLDWASEATKTLERINDKFERFREQFPGPDAPPSGSLKIDLARVRGESDN